MRNSVSVIYEKKCNENLKCQVLGTFESGIFEKKNQGFIYDYMKKIRNILKCHFRKKIQQPSMVSKL